MEGLMGIASQILSRVPSVASGLLAALSRLLGDLGEQVSTYRAPPGPHPRRVASSLRGVAGSLLAVVSRLIGDLGEWVSTYRAPPGPHPR